ncbi:excalibur calcium-binding domain-containing protein [Streptomyces sp. NPDC006997]|uniref:excalibur calcium-binding domain-containing protein n=1 Tax=Streptomyces sp. NPDC006997 TaxID=3155356 RepID=UPI0034056F75
MKSFRKPAAMTLAALALAAVPATAVAHDGTHPFPNCSEAYENGYADISETDEHYGKHLDRDGDGVGCDQPPADFVPAASGAGTEGTDLAETGADGVTLYLAVGTAVLLVGGGTVYLTVRRRDPR